MRPLQERARRKPRRLPVRRLVQRRLREGISRWVWEGGHGSAPSNSGASGLQQGGSWSGSRSESSKGSQSGQGKGGFSSQQGSKRGRGKMLYSSNKKIY